MPTSVHLPRTLLEAVDRRARALRISRNQLVVRALQRELRDGSEWSAGFFERLARPDPDVARAVDELLQAVRKERRSKAPKQW
jgi:predicted transcriptional regulator